VDRSELLIIAVLQHLLRILATEKQNVGHNQKASTKLDVVTLFSQKIWKTCQQCTSKWNFVSFFHEWNIVLYGCYITLVKIAAVIRWNIGKCLYRCYCLTCIHKLTHHARWLTGKCLTRKEVWEKMCDKISDGCYWRSVIFCYKTNRHLFKLCWWWSFYQKNLRTTTSANDQWSLALSRCFPAQTLSEVAETFNWIQTLYR